MTLNVVYARQELSKIIIVRIESGSLLNILKASAIMFMFVGGYRLLVPLSSVWVTLVPVIVGSLVYGILILRFDSKIYEELKGIMLKMKVVWPERL
jgi:CHASE2 domain-containing sensor protein